MSKEAIDVLHAVGRSDLAMSVHTLRRELDEARARVQHIEHERLSTLLRMAAEFDAAPDDAAFESPHPIFLLAEERDALKAENARLCENSDRYLFLRTRITSDDGYLVLVNVPTRFDAPNYAEIDAEIDAARRS